MKMIVYLLPPMQRTVARFVNLTSRANWADRILKVYHNLSKEEKEIFIFVSSNASLTKELVAVMSCVNFVEKECKQRGFIKITVMKCEKQIRTIILQGQLKEAQNRVAISAR